MRVLLISGNTAETPYPVYPVGMSVVARSLKDKGYEVSLFDFLLHDCSLEKLVAHLKTFQPEAVGVSIRNIDNVNLVHEQRYLDDIQAIVAAVKKVHPVPIILGGSGFSLMPEKILKYVDGDYGIKGEGEEAFDALLQLLADGQTPPERIVQAVASLDQKQILSAYYDPDILPFYLEKSHFVPIQTKRGCARKCSYCTYPLLEGSQIRARHPSDVVDDIERLSAEGKADFIFFVDSLFNDVKGTYRELIHEMHRRGTNVPWTAFFGPNRELDDAIVALMQETGLRSAEIGADAATDSTLKGLRKGFRFSDVVACNELFLRHGISTAHYYMLGGPNETPETIEEGIENICGLRKTVNFMFFGIRIIPDTPLMQRAIEDGVLAEDNDMLDPVYYISPHIDKEQVEARLVEAFKDKPHCVFPPDQLDDKLQLLYRLGYNLDASYNLLTRE